MAELQALQGAELLSETLMEGHGPELPCFNVGRGNFGGELASLACLRLGSLYATATRQEEVRECCDNWLEEAPRRSAVMQRNSTSPQPRSMEDSRVFTTSWGWTKHLQLPNHRRTGSLTQLVTDSIRSSHRGSAKACKHEPWNFCPNSRSTLDSDCLQGAAGYPQQQYPPAEAKARVHNTVTSCFTLQEAISHEEHKEVEEVIEPALDKGTLDKQ